MKKYLICCLLICLSVRIHGFHLSDFLNIEGNDSASEIASTRDFTESVSSYSPTMENTENARDENLLSFATTNIASKTSFGQESSRQSTQYSTLDSRSESVNSNISYEIVEASTESPISNNSNATGSTSSGEITEETEMNKSTISIDSGAKTNGSNPETNQVESEEEMVVLRKPSHAQNVTSEENSKFKKMYIKAVELISDTYTLSILLPVAAGIVFASTIIITITACRCLRQRCRHTRMRRKVLPDAVKNLRPSDRARLLAESSDDEF